MSPKKVLTAEEYRRKWMGNVRAGAVKARQRGRTFHLFRMEVLSTSVGALNSSSHQSTLTDVPGALQTIEEAGWTLLDMSYVFVPTKHQSHMLTDSANVAGTIVGMFTFRRTPDAPPPPPLSSEATVDGEP